MSSRWGALLQLLQEQVRDGLLCDAPQLAAAILVSRVIRLDSVYLWYDSTIENFGSRCEYHPPGHQGCSQRLLRAPPV